MQLSIIIVNYKTPQLVIDCLHSVYEQTTGLLFEVIVVDNSSLDNSETLIRSAFPAVKWISLNYNAGFARANNAGIRESTGECVLLLNSDTLNINNAIGKCYTAFQHSTYVGCGVQLLNADGTPQISGNYFMTGGLNNLLSLPYMGSVIKFLARLLQVKKPHVADAKNETEVDWINGAFLMVKNAAIEKAGMLDEDFFLYAEEAEWCSRIRKYGKCCIYGQYHVIHLQGETVISTFSGAEKGYKILHDRKGLQLMLSNFVRIRKQYGTGWFLLQLFAYTLEVPLYFILRLVQNLFGLKNPFDNFSKGVDYASNIARLWSYVPVILSGRPFFYKVL